MRQLTDEEFLEWVQNEDPPKELDQAIVLVTGQSCPKCAKLKNELNNIRHPDIPEYKFSGKSKEIAASLKEFEVSEVPVFLIKFIGRYKMFYKTLIQKWNPPKEAYEMECIFDAINQGDYLFFGYNEYGDPLEKETTEYDNLFDSLTRTLKGSLSDPRLKKEFEKAIDHIGQVVTKEELDVVEEEKHAS